MGGFCFPKSTCLDGQIETLEKYQKYIKHFPIIVNFECLVCDKYKFCRLMQIQAKF